MLTEISEEKVKEIIRQCEQNINDGCTDTLRSYEEGVKDTLEWLFCGNSEPILVD